MKQGMDLNSSNYRIVTWWDPGKVCTPPTPMSGCPEITNKRSQDPGGQLSHEPRLDLETEKPSENTGDIRKASLCELWGSGPL